MNTNIWKLAARCLALLSATLVVLPTARGGESPVGDAEQEIKPATIELGRPVDFTRDIYPMLERNCVACHNVSEKEGDFVAENVASILTGGDSGPATVAGKPEESLLYRYATRGEEPHMPPLPNQVGARALTAQEVGLLRQWILEGAQVGSETQRPAPLWQPVPPDIRSIHCVALSPCNRFVFWGRANQIYVDDLLAARDPQRLADPNLVAIRHAGKPMYPNGAAHRDLVHSLALSPDGTLLASGGYRVVKFWRRPSNARKSEMSLTQGVSALAVSDDGQWLAAGTSQNQIELWDLQAGKPVATLVGHTSAVSALQFTTSGDRLFSCSQDKTIRSWKAPSGEFLGQIQTDSPVNSLAINKDADRLVSAHADNAIRIWDVSVAVSAAVPAENENDTAAKPLLQIVGHTKPVTSVAFLFRDNMQIVSGSDDATVRIWNMTNGQQLLSINYGGPVRAVAVRGDNQAIAAVGPDDVARLWDCSGKQVAEFRGTPGSRRHVTRLREEQIVASQRVEHANNALSSVKKESDSLENVLKKVRDDKNTTGAALDEVRAKAQMAADVLTSAKEELARNESDPVLRQKVAEAEAEAKKIDAAVETARSTHQAAGQAAEIAEDSAQKVQQSLQLATARLSSLQQRKKVAEEQLQTALADDPQTAIRPVLIAFSPDGSQIATAGTDHLVRMFDAASGEPVESFAGHESPVTALVFGRDNSLVTGAADQRVIIWDLNPPWQLAGQLGVSPDNPLDTSASPFASRVLALDFSSDGRILATGGGEPSRSGELMLWDVASRSRLRQIVDAHSDTVLGVEFSRDDTYLLSGAADKFVKVFHVKTGQEIRSFEGHTHHVLDVSWKADGNTIVSAGADQVIKYWDIDTGQQIRTIGGYAKQVTSVQFPGTGDDIVSCSGDKSVRLHTASNGKNYRNFGGGTDYMYSVAASRDLTIVVAGGEDGVLRIWHGKDGSVWKTLDPPGP